MLHVYGTPGCENSMKFIFECSRSLFSHFRATMYYSVCHIDLLHLKCGERNTTNKGGKT